MTLKEDQQLAALYHELADSFLAVISLKPPAVVWETPPYSSEDWIVVKVTSKRIVIRRIGRTCCEQFNRDGTAVSKYSTGVIDIEATFGKRLR